MLRNKKIFTGLILWSMLLGGSILQGQDALQNKYNKYRQRFTTQFLGKTVNPRQAGNFIAVETRYYNGKNTNVDVTWYLGMYLAVLATEYHLLKEEHREKKALASLQEINHILITINRLDSVAETYYGKPPSINGFFVRRDNAAEVEEMSQDQVWGLLYGFRFVVEYVDNKQIIDTTRAISKRIVKALNPLVKGKRGNSKHRWMIIDPKGNVVQPPVDLYSTRYAFVLALEAILGEEVDIPGGKNLFARKMYYLSHAMAYHRFLFRQDHNMFNTYGIMCLYILAEPKKALPLSIQVENMVKEYYPEGVFAHFPLSAALLSHQELPVSSKYYIRILNEAPPQGPEFRAKSNLWNRTNIFGAFWQDYNQGKYNGLDFMLLHNLYRIFFETKR